MRKTSNKFQKWNIFSKMITSAEVTGPKIDVDNQVRTL